MGSEKKYKHEFKDFNKIEDISVLQEYIDERPYSHTSYFHYTSLEVIDKILKNNRIWVSCVKGFNDEIDKKQFGDDELDLYYSLCFSGGVSENIPLWYLYSGTDGKGGRLRLNATYIEKLIKNSKYYLYEKRSGAISEDTLLLKRPLNNDDMDIQFKDIVYYDNAYKKESDKAWLKYNTLTNYQINYESFLKKYKNKNIGFCKHLIWFYEKEIRLLIKLKGEAKEIIKQKLNNDKNSEFVIVLCFEDIKDEIRKNLKITLAPNHKDINGVLNSDKDDNINKFHEEFSNVCLSKHAGEINMKIKCNCQNQKQEEKEK